MTCPECERNKYRAALWRAEAYKQSGHDVIQRPEGAEMTEAEMQLDMLVAELETENRMMRARNERLEKELGVASAERDRFKSALERILSVSRVALWDGRPEGTEEVGSQAHTKEHDD
jgi:hypothetical protein